MNKIIFGKKAQGGLDLSSDTIIRIVLSVGAILLLTIFIVKIWNVFVPDTEKATIRNFEQLIASIKNMEEGASFSSYPLFVDEDYAIVGYQSGERANKGICPSHKILSETENPKPEQCGIGEEGCLCLCENTGDFATVCKENDQVEQCATVETFGKDYSFTGGSYNDGSGSCSFALVRGAENVQNVYMKKTEDTVRICAKECDISSSTETSLTSLLSSGGIILFHYEIRITDNDYYGTPPGYEQKLTYDSSSKKYTLEESTSWSYGNDPDIKTTTYTALTEVVAYIKTQVAWPEAAKVHGITEGGTVSITVSLQAEEYNAQEYGTYTSETISTFLDELAGTSAKDETVSSSIQTTGKNVLLIGDSQSMGTYGDTLYTLFKADDYTTNKYAVCGSTPSYFTEGLAIISSACNAEYVYDDGNVESVSTGDTPLLAELIEKHTPDTVFVTFASNGYEWYGSSEETIQKSVTTLAQKITSQGSSCFWAGPPQGPHYPDIKNYQQFKDIIKESTESAGCTFIDSEEYTNFAFCGETSFGCDADVHFDGHGAAGKAAAQAWAQGVYDDFPSSLPTS